MWVFKLGTVLVSATYFVCIISLLLWVEVSSVFAHKQCIYLENCHSLEICCGISSCELCPYHIHHSFNLIRINHYMLPNCSEGGFFNAIMSFPNNYPNSPPTVKFTSDIWHPNGWFLSQICMFDRLHLLLED